MRAKNGRRFAQQLSGALELSQDELCSELGLYDCVEEAHLVVMGGVDPAGLGVAVPLPVAPVTAPIAYDRVALNACLERAEQDFQAPEDAVLFAGLTTPEVSAETRDSVVSELYQRLLHRDATELERESLSAFFTDTVLPHTSDPREAYQQWAGLSCFAVATTSESLFY
ncbi:MAG: hypothetical protein ACRBN8_23305 [Nannocystales bacterium]